MHRCHLQDRYAMLIQIRSLFAIRTDQPARAAGHAVFSLAMVLALAGCAGLSVGQSGGPFPSPGTVDVSAGADIEIGSLRALLDGADKTSAFAWSGPGLRSLSATLTRAPGMHSVQATANVRNGLYHSYDPKSAQANFDLRAIDATRATSDLQLDCHLRRGARQATVRGPPVLEPVVQAIDR